MENKLTGNEPAMPHGMYGQQEGTGLTIRQHFASMAMQGLMAVNDKGNIDWENGVISCAQISVQAADALIEQLNQSKTITK